MPKHASLFKTENTFAVRKKESERVRSKFTDRIPVICEVDSRSRSPLTVPNVRFLVPSHYTCGEFLNILRTRASLKPEEALFVFINDVSPSSDTPFRSLYAAHVDEDGFLYMTVATENTFGAH